jgi:hypothetical protein
MRAASGATGGRVAFYCMSSDIYFLGAVAMINSLRLLRHDQPVYLLDLGMRPGQRALIEPHVTVVPLEDETPPWLAKTVAPLAHPAETMVLIDADMIVTRPLGELIEQAAAGRVVAVEHGSDRHVPEWGELLGLGPVRRQTYVCSGLVIAGRVPGEGVLSMMDELSDRVEIERTWFGRRESDYPFLFPEQDILNAILASRVEAERLVVVDRRLEPIPPFGGVTVVDEDSLRCVLDGGGEPYLLHHYAVKPWLDETPDGPYTQLLRRLLGGGDVAIRVPEREIPTRLRSGVLARALRERASGAGRFDAYVREPFADLFRGRGKR